MKSNIGAKAAIVLVVIAGFAAVAAFGVPAAGIPSVAGVRTGIDIQGGISVTLEPEEGYTPTAQQLTDAKTIIESRLDAQNVFDRNIAVDTAAGRILVEIPYKSNEGGSGILTSDFNAQKTVVDYIGKTANLTFRPVDESTYDSETGMYAMSDEILLAGERVVDATGTINAGMAQQSQGSPYVIDLSFDGEGTRDFAEATQRLLGKKIAIWMDDVMLLAPTVNDVIPNGKAVITGQQTLEAAKMLAAQIKSGSMPFKLEASELTQITPLLGEGALTVTIRAGIIAFILVFLLMLACYRLPGLISCVALAGMVVAMLVIMALGQITLTLPGIAGIILSIGMSIDANVLISERIREELQAGRTIKAALEAGFRNSFTAILDSNLTTIISAVVLYALGSGPIRGFAVTLALGVLLSFFSALTVTRALLRAAVLPKFARSMAMFRVKPT